MVPSCARCHNPSFGLMTKARACKGAGEKGSPGITSHVLGSVGECEIEHSHSQVSSHFGSWNPRGLPNLQRAIARVKTIGLNSSLYHWKALGT
jgi:hypothetical protein